jgi:hypothetical protein
MKLDTNEIRTGKHLDLAREFTIEQFVAYYVDHGKVRENKKYGIEIIEPLYTDAVSRYFGLKHSHGLIDFFKIKLSDLKSVNLANIDGMEIRKNFIEQVVQEADKNKVAKNEKNCSMTHYIPEFIYDYKKETNAILVTYKWRISCEFLFNIINKTYVALYNIETKTFTIIK